MKALVLGGTGFIGRRLVNNLLSSGEEVTLATSGKSPNPYGDKVTAIRADRFDRDGLMQSLSGLGFQDAVFDTIGYRSMDLRNSLDALVDRAGRYVYISSASVYHGMEGTLGEDEFDAAGIDATPGLESTYHEGKRKSEAYLLKNAKIPFAIARFPNVMGYDDSTMRFQDHVRRVLEGDDFHFQDPEGRRNHVWVEDAGRFLAWLGREGNNGIYNAASPDSMTAGQLVTMMAEALGKDARIHHGSDRSDSRYAAAKDLVISVKKAENMGFKFTPTSQWIGIEARTARDSGLKAPNSMKYTDKFFP